MKNNKLELFRRLGFQDQISGPSDRHATVEELNLIIEMMSVLMNAVAEIAEGGLDKYLQYGTNVVASKLSNGNIIRLPEKPVKGFYATVINTSGYTLFVYPSMVGGSINGIVDAMAQIPSDGKPYTFQCWENPLPGAWSWTPPAISQYDSGEIKINSFDFNVVAASRTGLWISGDNDTFYATTAWGYDGINKAQFVTPKLVAGSATAPFKPSPSWNKVLKLKVYTNLSADGADVRFGLTQGSGISYYNITTKAFVSNGSGSSGNFDEIGTCDRSVPGASLGIGVLTTNIGDAGTCYGEYIFSSGGGLLENIVGDYQLPNTIVSSVLREAWLSRYLNFCIQPNQTLSGLKIRFFIEYN
jgi:hypothetical protein